MGRNKYDTVTLKLSLNVNPSNIFFLPLEEFEHGVLFVIKPSIIGDNAGS